MMIDKRDMKLYIEHEDTDFKIDRFPKHLVFDRIKKIEFKFKYHKNTVVINQVVEMKVDLKGDIIVKCLFSPILYNRLGEGSIISEMIVSGCAVDPENANELLEFETSFNYIENKNVVFGFNTEDDMTIYFSNAHKEE